MSIWFGILTTFVAIMFPMEFGPNKKGLPPAAYVGWGMAVTVLAVATLLFALGWPQ